MWNTPLKVQAYVQETEIGGRCQYQLGGGLVLM